MVRYTLLLIFWSIVTPMKAQIEQCDVLKLTDAIVISEYLPCPRRDSLYVKGNHYICFYGRIVPFMVYARFNEYLIKDLESNTNIPDSLKKIENDEMVDYLLYDYTYDLRYSKLERRNFEKKGRIESNEIYKRPRKKKLYVAYAFEGEIVMYKTRRKTIIHTGFKDPIYTMKPLKLSKFAVLKKAERLRPLSQEEAHSMNLEKVKNSYIKIFAPE